jgi:DNA polymerase-3 subunit epsilon
MTINLTRDLVFFDLETTGLNVIRDRIVQIALVKLRKNGQANEEFSTLVNPGIPISEESMAIHGITPKDVANKPTFHSIGAANLGFHWRCRPGRLQFKSF